jgi:hypothetical protein
MLLGVLTIVLAVTVIAACGGAGKGTDASKRIATSAGSAPGDYDKDDGKHPRVDNDKLTVRDYGHAAGRAERLQIAALVGRYLASAAADDGLRGCELLDTQMALAAHIDYGVYGPPYLRGARSCAAVLSRLFEHEHRHLAMAVQRLKVKSVRVEGASGFAILDLGGTREGQMAVERERSGWKVEALLDEKVHKVE